MAKNPKANKLTFFGVVFSVVAAPVVGPVALLGAPLVLGARLFRAGLDGIENSEEEKRKETKKMKNLPTTFVGSTAFPHQPHYPYPYMESRPIVVPDAKAVVASQDARRAAEMIERTSLDRLAGKIFSAPTAEFSRQGRGSRGGIRRTKSIFGTESIDFFIDPL